MSFLNFIYACELIAQKMFDNYDEKAKRKYMEEVINICKKNDINFI